MSYKCKRCNKLSNRITKLKLKLKIAYASRAAVIDALIERGLLKKGDIK